MAKRSEREPALVPDGTAARVAEIEAEIAAIGDPDAMVERFAERYRAARKTERESIPAIRRKTQAALNDMRVAERDAVSERERLAELREELEALTAGAA